MFKKIIDTFKLTDPDAEPREVIKDAHQLAGEMRRDVSVERDGIKTTVHYKPGSKSLKSVRTPEAK